MAIEKLPNGNYRAIVFLRKKGGKQKRVSKTFPRRKDARLWESEKEREKRLGTLQVLDRAATFFAISQDFLDKTKERRSPHTYTNYKNRLEKHIFDELGSMQIQSVRAAHIIEIQRKMIAEGYSEGFVNYTTTIVSSVFSYAINGILQLNLINPCKQVDPIRYQKKTRHKKYLTSLEIDELLKVSSSSHYLDLIIFLLNHGPRISEACALQVKHFNKKRHSITIEQQFKPYIRRKDEPVLKGAFMLGSVKNYESREIFLNEVTFEIIERLTEGKKLDGFIFAPKKITQNLKRKIVIKRGKNPQVIERLVVNSMSYGFNKEIFKPLAQKAGLDPDITVHNLRDTFATQFYRETRDLYALSKILGHKNITTTQIYADIIDEDKREYASAVLIGKKSKGSKKGSKSKLTSGNGKS